MKERKRGREREKKERKTTLYINYNFCSFACKHQTQTLVICFLIKIEKIFFHYYKTKSFIWIISYIYIFIYLFIYLNPHSWQLLHIFRLSP
jgi:hypothetical protein